MSTFRLKLLEFLIGFYWRCESWLETLPSRKTGTTSQIFFEPGTLTAIGISLLVSAASMTAQFIITTLLAPKPKPEVRGKLQGEIQATDSVLGATIPRIYGGRPEDGTAGGVELGGNIIWMSEIRVISTSVPTGTGGGKGGMRNRNTSIQKSYKVDLAVGVGAGRLKLLRLKLNEDTVYNLLGGGILPPSEAPIRYEAEDIANTLAGGAAVTADAGCSGGSKVTGIGLGGTLTINGINSETQLTLDPPDPTIRLPYFEIAVKYKCVGDKTAFVRLDGDGGIYTFPDSGGSVFTKYILRSYSGGDHALEFSNPDATGPEIDCVDVGVIYLEEPTPTGIRDDAFPAEPAADNLLMPSPYLTDTNAFERYNLPSPEATGGVFETTLSNGAQLAWYEGTEDQPVDAVIAAVVDAQYGAGSTPAFRNTCYFRLQNLDFSKWGSIPAIRVVVENIDLKTVEEICLFEGQLAGLEATDFDLGLTADMPIRGLFTNTGDSDPPAKVFEACAVVHNINFTESVDGKILAIDLNDRTPVADIDESDLGAYVAEEADEVPVDGVVSVLPDFTEDLVRQLELQFQNPLSPSDYRTAREQYIYPYTASDRKESRSIPVVLLPSEAQTIVRREMQKHHLKGAPDAFVVSHKFAWLNAGDVVRVKIDGEWQKRRIDEKTGSAPGVYEITASNEELYVTADTLDDETPLNPKTNALFPANTVGTLMDIPALQDSEKGKAGIYAAARSKGFGAWSSASLYRFRGADWELMCTFNKQAAIGRAVNAVSDVPGALVEGFFDDAAELTVDFPEWFEPTSVDSLQAEDGANPYLIGSEVCVVQTWTRISGYPNRWKGEDFYRVLKNSHKGADTHVAGERVVYLDDAVKFISLDETEIGLERQWKFVTSGGILEDAGPIAFTFGGDNLYNRESSAPIIGQLFNATNTEIRIGVSNFSADAKFRLIEVSDVVGMTSPLTAEADTGDYNNGLLSETFRIINDGKYAGNTYFVRIAHSSNGRDWGEYSNVLEIRFADSPGDGTTGSFDPSPELTLEID